MPRYNTVETITSVSTTASVVPQAGTLTTLTGASPYTVTLGAPTLYRGQSQSFWNNSSVVITLSTPSGYVNGTYFAVNTHSTVRMNPNSVLQLTSDGTNYIITGNIGNDLFNVDVVTTYTALIGQTLWCDTSGGAFTVTLPGSPSKGDRIRVIDVSNTFDTANLTLGRNSQVIMGLAEDLVVATEGAAFDLVYYNSSKGWRIFTI